MKGCTLQSGRYTLSYPRWQIIVGTRTWIRKSYYSTVNLTIRCSGGTPRLPASILKCMRNASSRQQGSLLPRSQTCDLGSSEPCCREDEKWLTQSNPVWGGLPVDPESHPGDDHQQAARHVDVDQEIAHVTTKCKLRHQHGKLTCAIKMIMHGLSWLFQRGGSL